MKKLQYTCITLLTLVLLLGIISPVYAQIQEPDAGFSIIQVEAYRNYLELNDQLYLITANIENSTTPDILIDEAYVVRLMTAAGAELGTTTFYSYFDSGYDMGIASIYFTAATAPAWNQPYELHIQGNPTLHWLDTTAIHSMTGAKSYSGATFIFTDETAVANDATTSDMTLIPGVLPIVNDAYYFGSSSMFNILTLKYSTPSAGPVWLGTYDYEYWNGNTWISVGISLSDPTMGFTNAASTYDITWDCPTDWQMTAVDGDNLYWVRFRVETVTGPASGAAPRGDQSWTNTLDNPPSIQTDAFSLWFDDETTSGTESALTTRIRGLGTILENNWGGVPSTNLVETVAGELKLTVAGEDYFTNSIFNLRRGCPDLFADVMTTPDFGEQAIIKDSFTGGDDTSQNVFGINWYAQTFTASRAYSIDGIRLKMFRVGTPGNLTVSIRATLLGVPTGVDLATGVINGNNFQITDTGEWENTTFVADYVLTTGSVYAIVSRAIVGDATNYVGWRSNSGIGYTGGQSYVSINSGVAWAAVAPIEDFMFITTGTEAMEMSYRDILANRLVGTSWDMTGIGSSIGLSRIWASTIVWLAFLIPIAWAVTKTTKSYKPVLPVITLLMPIGALAGFVYLEIAVLAAFFFTASSIFVLFYRGAP